VFHSANEQDPTEDELHDDLELRIVLDETDQGLRVLGAGKFEAAVELD